MKSRNLGLTALGDEPGPFSKKAKRSCKWQPDWKRYHLSESKRGVSYAHCDICRTDFSVASGGINEVKRHVENKKHKELVAGMAGQSTLASAISRFSVTDQVTIAEVYFSMFVAEHNLSFLAAVGSFSKLCSLTVKLLASIRQVEQKQLLLVL